MGIVHKNANFCDSKTDFPQEKKLGGIKEKEAQGYLRKFRVHSHMVVARLSHRKKIFKKKL